MRPIGRGPQERFALQKELLNQGRFFKLVCGAGNEEPDEVYALSLVYALAGASGIDVSANSAVVRASVKATNDAAELASEFGLDRYFPPFVTVSVGMSGDPHVRKAKIVQGDCTKCNACIPVCPTDAIPSSLVIINTRCIGCGACGVACQDDAIAYSHKSIQIESVLRDCVVAGAENLELHAAIADHDTTLHEWQVATRAFPYGFVSVCLDRRYLSNHDLRKRLELLLNETPGRMIVQADGIPMSGGRDDFNTTLQAVAMADIVDKMRLPVHILISGGTNAKTVKLARMCGVPNAGVSIGTFARHLIYDLITMPGFPTNDLLKQAVARARPLVEACNSRPPAMAGHAVESQVGSAPPRTLGKNGG